MVRVCVLFSFALWLLCLFCFVLYGYVCLFVCVVVVFVACLLFDVCFSLFLFSVCLLLFKPTHKKGKHNQNNNNNKKQTRIKHKHKNKHTITRHAPKHITTTENTTRRHYVVVRVVYFFVCFCLFSFCFKCVHLCVLLSVRCLFVFALLALLFRGVFVLCYLLLWLCVCFAFVL